VLLQLREISKRYPGTVALDDVSLDIVRGEIHCLLGENGAGKSTLIRILAGAEAPSAGEVLVDGEPVTPRSPADALKLGIVTIHQQPQLADSLTVQENLLLGREPHRCGVYGRRFGRREAAGLIEVVQRPLPLDLPVRNLSYADRQLLDIARAFGREIKVAILDEATASLGTRESQHLFEVLRGLARRGCAVIFVTHRLEEALEIGDTITVLRDGKNVVTRRRGEFRSVQEVIELITGRPAAAGRRPAGSLPDGAIAVDVIARARDTAGKSTTLAHVQAHASEIVGLVGLVGSGQELVTRSLVGDAPGVSLEGAILGKTINRLTPRRARRLGVRYVPGDRLRRGLFLTESAMRNVTTPNCESLGLAWISGRQERRLWRVAEQLDVRPRQPRKQARLFSGGNQQKLLLARAMVGAVKVLVLEEPTLGLDVGAREELYRIIADLAAGGIAILISTTDVEEALSLCRRTLVFRGPRAVAEVDSAATDEHALHEIMAVG
jgi:ABC-type sugar transport system ATPase subunit